MTLFKLYDLLLELKSMRLRDLQFQILEAQVDLLGLQMKLFLANREVKLNVKNS